MAALCNGVVEGDGDVKVNSFAKIEEGHPGAISFLANPKYAHYIYTTESSVVLVSKTFVPEKPVPATLIRVDDPYATVAYLLTMVQQMMTPKVIGIEQPSFIADGVTITDDCYIGAFAYIAKGAKIGKGVKIYPQVYVGEDVEIGDNTILYPGVKVYHRCKVGCNCIIHSGAVIGADGFGFAPTSEGYDKIPQIGNVEIADDVEIGANTTIDRAMMGSTKVLRGVKLDNLIQIGHNCVVGEHTVMAAQAGVAGSTKVGSRVMVGGQVGLAGHIKVGDGAQIAAQSGIPKDVKTGARVFGSPAMDIIEYGRQACNIRNLPSLYARVEELEKLLNKQ
ncbi:MAG: UDP-3-O-(3-hydroxymyristoyl)glucosamine N-acyltransferase [Paramuribaculum sp.]|nr:UDP-3-O-(3-hydroxymyristoyl)glucosamine N-acyltransferase [Paramuribaculum sp.]